MTEQSFDLVIIGAGPGGYVTAIRAAHRGLRVALIEAAAPGGVCLHTGCIPTKTMVASVGLFRQARAAAQWGVNIAQAEAQLSTLRERRHKIVQQLAKGVQMLLAKNAITLFNGRGAFCDSRTVEVRNSTGESIAKLTATRAIVIATGSRPTDLPIAIRDGQSILNSDDLLELADLPPSLLIIGGGYIGCEFASIFAALGSQVTVVEAADRLLPGMDRDLGTALLRSFKASGITVHLGQTARSSRIAAGVELTLADDKTVTGNKLLVAVGRISNTEGLGLENVGVELQGRNIGVNDSMETSAPHIYAVGDVTGKMALAHVATAQGRVVIENLLAPDQPRQAMNYDQIPAAVFTHPEISTVGLTEEEATRRGLAIRVGRFPFAAIGKALAAGETEGFVKLIADAETGKMLGGHIIGGHASELIGQVTLAVKLGATAQQLTETIFAHPTLSEAILEAAEGIFHRPTHGSGRA